MVVGLLAGLVNGSNHTKCVSFSNQKCMIQPTLINLYPNEYSQEFYYYAFAVKLDRSAVEKSEHFQHDYRKKCIKSFNKRYINQM